MLKIVFQRLLVWICWAGLFPCIRETDLGCCITEKALKGFDKAHSSSFSCIIGPLAPVFPGIEKSGGLLFAMSGVKG